MFLDHRPRHPWLKVRIFQYFWPRKSHLNWSEDQPQVSIFSFRAVFSHRPVSVSGPLSRCCRGILMSKLAKFITPFPIFKFLYCCFQELQRELKENKVGVSADSVSFYPNYALFTLFYYKNTGKLNWMWLLIVRKRRYFMMWQFFHGTKEMLKKYFFQAFTKKNRLGGHRTRKKLWKFGMFWKCLFSMFFTLTCFGVG